MPLNTGITKYTQTERSRLINEIREYIGDHPNTPIPEKFLKGYRDDLDEYLKASPEERREDFTGRPKISNYVADYMMNSVNDPEVQVFAAGLPDVSVAVGDEVVKKNYHGPTSMLGKLAQAGVITTLTLAAGGATAGAFGDGILGAAFETALNAGVNRFGKDALQDTMSDRDLTDPDADLGTQDRDLQTPEDATFQDILENIDNILLESTPTSSPVDFEPVKDTRAQAREEASSGGGGVLSQPTQPPVNSPTGDTTGRGGSGGTGGLLGQVLRTATGAVINGGGDSGGGDGGGTGNADGVLTGSGNGAGNDGTTNTSGGDRVASGNEFFDKFIDNLPQILGDAAGGAVSQVFVDSSQKDLKEAAQIYADSAKFKPYDVTSDVGSGTFDEETGKAIASLSPELQGLLTKQFEIAGFNLDQVKEFGTGEESINRELDLVRKLSDTRRQSNYNTFFDRLQSQGRTGTTGGRLQTEAFFDSQNNEAMQQELSAIQSARSESTRLNALGADSVQAAIRTGQAPLEELKIGANIGVGAGNINASANAPLFDAAVQGAYDDRVFGGELAKGTRDFVFNTGKSLFT